MYLHAVYEERGGKKHNATTILSESLMSATRTQLPKATTYLLKGGLRETKGEENVKYAERC